MSENTRTPQQQHIAETWGEAFTPLAGHPRLEFDQDAIRVVLWKRIKVGTEEVDKLAIQEPTLAQLQALDRVSGEMGKTRALLMQVCGLTEREAGALGIRDITVCGRVIEAFTEAARVTGA